MRGYEVTAVLAGEWSFVERVPLGLHLPTGLHCPSKSRKHTEPSSEGQESRDRLWVKDPTKSLRSLNADFEIQVAARSQ